MGTDETYAVGMKPSDWAFRCSFLYDHLGAARQRTVLKAFCTICNGANISTLMNDLRTFLAVQIPHNAEPIVVPEVIGVLDCHP